MAIKSIRTDHALKPFSWLIADGPHPSRDADRGVGSGVADDGVHIGVVIKDGRQPSSGHISATNIEYFQLRLNPISVILSTSFTRKDSCLPFGHMSLKELNFKFGFKIRFSTLVH